MLLGLRAGVHLHLGYGTFAEYVERLFGYKPRWTEERLRVAEALETLPALEQSLRDGAMSWSAVRELTRVASAEASAPGSKSRGAAPFDRSKSWSPAMRRATCPAIPASPTSSGTSFVSR